MVRMSVFTHVPGFWILMLPLCVVQERLLCPKEGDYVTGRAFRFVCHFLLRSDNVYCYLHKDVAVRLDRHEKHKKSTKRAKLERSRNVSGFSTKLAPSRTADPRMDTVNVPRTPRHLGWHDKPQEATLVTGGGAETKVLRC